MGKFKWEAGGTVQLGGVTDDMLEGEVEASAALGRHRHAAQQRGDHLWRERARDRQEHQHHQRRATCARRRRRACRARGDRRDQQGQRRACRTCTSTSATRRCRRLRRGRRIDDDARQGDVPPTAGQDQGRLRSRLGERLRRQGRPTSTSPPATASRRRADRSTSSRARSTSGRARSRRRASPKARSPATATCAKRSSRSTAT